MAVAAQTLNEQALWDVGKPGHAPRSLTEDAEGKSLAVARSFKENEHARH